MTAEPYLAGAYIALNLGWAKVFRAWVDPWLRRRVGAIMGVEIVWVEALRFPLRASIWGVTGQGDGRIQALVGLLAAGAMFAGAMVPIVALSFVLSLTSWVPQNTAHALYLVSIVLLVLFLRGATNGVVRSP